MKSLSEGYRLLLAPGYGADAGGAPGTGCGFMEIKKIGLLQVDTNQVKLKQVSTVRKVVATRSSDQFATKLTL